MSEVATPGFIKVVAGGAFGAEDRPHYLASGVTPTFIKASRIAEVYPVQGDARETVDGKRVPTCRVSLDGLDAGDGTQLVLQVAEAADVFAARVAKTVADFSAYRANIRREAFEADEEEDD